MTLLACIREVTLNLLYSNPLLGLNFFQATVDISLAPLNSYPVEILEGGCLKGSRRGEQWSLLQKRDHKLWQPRYIPPPGICQHSTAKKVWGADTWCHPWNSTCRPHKPDGLISLNPVNFKYRFKLFHIKVVFFTTNLKSADEVSTVTLNCPSSLISFFVTVPPNSLFNIFIFRHMKCEK